MEPAMQFENEIMKRLANIIVAERVGKALAVCAGDFPYADAMKCALIAANPGDENAVFEQITLGEAHAADKNLSSQAFAMDSQRIFSQNKTDDDGKPLRLNEESNAVMRKTDARRHANKLVKTCSKYDLIIFSDWFQQGSFDETADILRALIAKANRQVLFITSCPPSGTKFHPAAFAGWDFSFEQCATASGLYYLFSFFCPSDYAPLPIDRKLQNISKQLKPIKPKKKLNLAYILPHRNLTGGMKALLTQMKALNAAGHHVTAYYQGQANRAFPPWSGFDDNDVSGQVIIPPGKQISDYIKPETDLIILGWFRQAVAFLNSPIPVALWEQGSEFMFGDLGRLLTSADPERKALHIYYRLPIHLLAVSPILQTTLKGVYGREAQYFPNIIDTEFYHPAESKTNRPLVILLVGYSPLRFKGFDWAIAVLRELSRECRVPFRVCWASQQNFTPPADLPFELTKYIALPQESLAELYRKCDVFFSPSLYESFALPPVEAFASGTAVAATDCGGIRVYANDKNALLIPQGDVKTALQSLKTLLEDSDLRDRLAKKGRETALQFTAGHIVEILEECLYNIFN
jgi:hypothetical protein